MDAARKLNQGRSPHVRPHLECSSTVWDPYYKQDIQTVEKIQCKDARFLTGNYSYQHSATSMLDDLNWPPLEQRRKNKRLTTFFKISNNRSPVTLPDYVKASTSRARSHDLSYIQIQTNYEQYKNSFLSRTIREWNALPPDLVHAVYRRFQLPSTDIHSLDSSFMFLICKYDVLNHFADVTFP